MFWEVRISLLICLIVSGIAFFYIEGMKRCKNHFHAAVARAFFVFFGVLTGVSFLPWDIPWYGKAFSLLAAVAGAGSAFIDAFYER